jgi:hypothetical protein
LIIYALMYLTMSAPSIDLSISTLFRILHILSILTGPNIFLSISLSKMLRLFYCDFCCNKCGSVCVEFLLACSASAEPYIG